MKMMKCTCLAGHDFEIPARRGRPPVWCDEHRASNKGVVGSKGDLGSGKGNLPPDDSKPAQGGYTSLQLTPKDGDHRNLEASNYELTRTLHCERGDHDYQIPVRRGKYPTNCPAHQPKPTERAPKSSASIERIVEKALEHPTAKSCHCDLSPQMTQEEIRALGGGCCQPQFVCGVLDGIRRQL